MMTRFFLLGCLSVPLLIANTRIASADSPIPLHEAVKDGKVKVSITGLGGSTGDAIQVVAQRQIRELLRISLAPGTVFKSISGKVQNMAGATIKGERVNDKTYRPSSEIILGDDKEHTFVIDAYCMDFRKDNPSNTDRFEVQLPDERTAQLFAVGKKSSASAKIIQSALWIDRDRARAEELKARFSVNDQDLKAANSLLDTLNRPVREPTDDAAKKATTKKDADKPKVLADPTGDLRVTRGQLKASEKAERPQEWFDLNAQLELLQFQVKDRKFLEEKRLRVMELDNKLFVESKDFLAMTPELAKVKVELELLERNTFTDKMAAIKAKMMVLEYASVSEDVQRLRHKVELMENTQLTLDIARKIVAQERMLELAATPALKAARTAANARLTKALESEPQYEEARKHALDLADRLTTDELVKSRAKRKDLMARALKELTAE